jgi:hypothetical protein
VQPAALHCGKIAAFNAWWGLYKSNPVRPIALESAWFQP